MPEPEREIEIARPCRLRIRHAVDAADEIDDRDIVLFGGLALGPCGIVADILGEPIQRLVHICIGDVGGQPLDRQLGDVGGARNPASGRR